ncbi:DUF1801 domain-containing protein [Chryseobacterium gambrini]|uniref:YdhG-like domain-containing protein n=1 Tax=Chryseobacterium gambrini TaxID=373672 RepID=A0A1N7MFJ3_9FLAO|nr:DUF1801 domain-containing protein [Chryseobacterium gambrini]SIS84751.1 protein of unknown function (DU1801) [Chryseobacterium gambrini]
MPQNKTVETEVNVTNFINSYVENEQKKEESFKLISLMSDWTGFEPKMWGSAIIGFGSYHYKYESGHAGDMPLISFSPRKSAFSLYVFSPTEETQYLLEELGKYRMGKSCIYVKKLSDIHLSVLEKMCRSTIEYLSKHHECACRKTKPSEAKQKK